MAWDDDTRITRCGRMVSITSAVESFYGIPHNLSLAMMAEE